MRDTTFAIVNKTRGHMPRVLFKRIKESVLGKRYRLSVALLTSREAAHITRQTKGRAHPSNVLSFSLSKYSGEILLCPATARAEAKRYGTAPEDFLVRLFIHGLLHLKGMRHGATMDSEERRIGTRFG